MSNESKFLIVLTKREAALWLTLLIVFTITTVSFLGFRDDSFFKYISFAGTVTSIVLAVIAILYSFFQGGQQSNILSNITVQSQQIEKSNTRLKENLDSFEEKLESLQRIESKVDEFVPKMDKGLQGIKTHIDNVNPNWKVKPNTADLTSGKSQQDYSPSDFAKNTLKRMVGFSRAPQVLSHIFDVLEASLNKPNKLMNIKDLFDTKNVELNEVPTFTELSSKERREIDFFRSISMIEIYVDIFFSLGLIDYDTEINSLKLTDTVDKDLIDRLRTILEAK